MATAFEWQVPAAARPQQTGYGFDLDRVFASLVSIRTKVPSDAFTAEVLGTERSGNGVVIRPDGLIVTIGYLALEASEVWLNLADGRTLAGDVLAYDQDSGFGLIQALERLNLPALELGSARDARPGTAVIAAGFGGVEHSVAAQVIARQEFAGYWEYLIDDAIFTAPAHPFWGGTGLIGPDGRLIGIGSLQLEQAGSDGDTIPINMYVPTDLLKPELDAMLSRGRPGRPPRPWLGLYAIENDDHVVIAGIASRGPAAKADLRRGDVVLSVGGTRIKGLAALFRGIWSRGAAGVTIPMTVLRDGRAMDITVPSGDRHSYLKAPSLN
jgi:S1-C subfamily serine protease